MPPAVLPTPQNIASAQADARSAYYSQAGLQEYERRLFLCVAPTGTRSTDLTPPVPTVTEILPTPRITNDPLDTVSQTGNIVRIQKFKIDGISRQYIDPDELRTTEEGTFWLVLSLNDLPLDDAGQPTVPTAGDIAAAKYPVYRMLGTPEWMQNGYRLELVEVK